MHKEPLPSPVPPPSGVHHSRAEYPKLCRMEYKQLIVPRRRNAHTRHLILIPNVISWPRSGGHYTWHDCTGKDGEH